MKKLLLSAMLSLAFASTSATAGTIDFNALGLAAGQSVEGTTIDGVTFNSENGVLVYELEGDGGIYDGYAGTNDITMQFAFGITSLSMRAGDSGGDPDAFGVSLYEFGTDTFLGYFSTPVFGNDVFEFYTLTVSGVGTIGRAVFDPGHGGVLPGDPTQIGGVVLSMVAFEPAEVPEPGSFALLGLGLAGLAAARRRK